ncbi:MAG: phenylalanine--tRNA ligase beta subunit [Patescibacteria group bacterium]|nr:MAG: phenylalanine--tRNA ligase beta subunit [Patescibacteria group bacterium]
MNVLIPFSWIKDYVKTDASVKDVAEALSMHALSVERIIDDDVLEIEVTPNRGDALSVLGISRELMAVLPANGFTAEWIKEEVQSKKFSGKDKLDVRIDDPSLVPRFSAIVLDNVKIKSSPDWVKERLDKVGIRSINNVVDVTNYCMVELGQPMHAFDYDKITDHKMIVRSSEKGEVITTLDSVKRTLPEGVIVIEDGSGRLIDLCGIMGGENTEVTAETKKVLLFVQMYDPVKIRKSSMSLGHRTQAALRFEKGVDFEGIIPSLRVAVKMLEDFTGGDVSSELIDIKNFHYPEKKIKIDYERINRVAGIEIGKDFVNSSLSSLGFIIKDGEAIVPSWRYGDIEIVEDLAEEVIRIYGYQNLPSLIPSGALPHSTIEKKFLVEEKAKDFLKYNGFFECYNYSMTPKNLAGPGPLKIKNPLSGDFAFLRSSLIPKLLDILNKNKGYSDKVGVFELGPVFLAKNGDLPDQPFMLAMATRGVEYLELKGYVEALLDDLGVVTDFAFEIVDQGNGILSCEMCFDEISSMAGGIKGYSPLTTFNSIKEDITLLVDGNVPFKKIEEVVKGADARVKRVCFKDMFKDALTLSIEFLDRDKQITSEDTSGIREEIVKRLGSLYGIKLKV